MTRIPSSEYPRIRAEPEPFIASGFGLGIWEVGAVALGVYSGLCRAFHSVDQRCHTLSRENKPANRLP